MANPTHTNGDSELLALDKHAQYYIPGGDISFLVEHILFKVHKYFFERESEWFISQFKAPTSPGSPVKGSGDAHAIVLEELTADDFARFLWVFYNCRYSIYEADTEEWETILRLANRWSFPEVKNLAVRELEKKDMLDVHRIKLYQANDVDRNLLVPRYAALCEREAPLTLDEGIDLGMETVLIIARGREEVRAARTASGARSPLAPTVHGPDLHEVVRQLFNIELIPDSEGTPTPGALTKTSAPEPTAPPPTPKQPQGKQGAQAGTTKKGGNKKTTVQTPTRATPAKAETPVEEKTPKEKGGGKTNAAQTVDATQKTATAPVETTTTTTTTVAGEAGPDPTVAPDTPSPLLDLKTQDTATNSKAGNAIGASSGSSAKADLFSLGPLSGPGQPPSATPATGDSSKLFGNWDPNRIL